MAPEEVPTLNLECWTEELSPAQKAAYERAEKEHNEVRNKLKAIVQEHGGESIFSGEVFTAYQVLGPVPGLEQISEPLSSLAKKKPPVPCVPAATTPRATVAPHRHASPLPDTPTVGTRRRSRRSYQRPPNEEETSAPTPPTVEIGDEDEDYTPLSKRVRQREKPGTSRDLSETRKTPEKPPETKQRRPKSPVQTVSPAPNVRPTEFTSIGGLRIGAEKEKKRATAEPSAIVDLTTDDTSNAPADSREISFSKIQGKTFPSLVVIARPSLRVADRTPTDRPVLDAKVKGVLVYPSAKFTEWLIQQGLIKSDQLCTVHSGTLLKLGMYSDASKFAYSGGYVWISNCCQGRFTSVFNGSIFEGSPHAPTVLLKLVYHWACQTSISNVVNWVKVDNLYMKRLYTMLRSICTLALCRHMPKLGGEAKAVEVGVISLGTTTQDGQQRQVKVEVLGVLDREANTIRLRAVDPPSDGDRSYKKRFAKILEPLEAWVHKNSTILTDLTVDKGTLHSMGYNNVQQVPPSEANERSSNANVMNYLRSIVPRMFQSTLSLLSRQIIQQFLNELVWRELYGTTPCTAFDNIVRHIAEQSRIENKESLMTRLNKVAADPFRQWVIVPDLVSMRPQPVAGTSRGQPTTTPSTTPGKRGRKSKDRSATESPVAPSPVTTTRKATASPSLPPEPPKKILLKKAKRDEEHASMVAGSTGGANSKPSSPLPAKKTPPVAASKQREDDVVFLESYYYGCTGVNSAVKECALPRKGLRLGCPECPELSFDNNVDLLDHFLRHAHEPPEVPEEGDLLQCRYCLQYMSSLEALTKHNSVAHPLETKCAFGKMLNCLICETSFSTASVLVGHMAKWHRSLEMPYRCAGCDFRSSSRRITIDHLYERHNRSTLLQCPFCQKMVSPTHANGPEALEKVLRGFLHHLRQHSKKTISKRCHKCALSFLSKGEHKFHSIFDHVSSSCEPTDVQALPTDSQTKIRRPKKKAIVLKELCTYRVAKAYSALELNMECGSICLECGNDFDSFNHIIGLLQCVKCAYQSACLPSVVNHSVACSAAQSPESVATLSTEMHCNCGFSSNDGNALARHLTACERGTVFSSVEAAQAANSSKRNMLDMLGLVRRDDEQPADQADQQQQEQEHDPAEGLEQDASTTAADTRAVEDAGQPAAAGTSGVSYDPSQSLYNIAATGSEQQFNTQLSLDDLGPSSVLPTAADTDCTPQLKDDYQSLATPRVPDQQDY
ncbi:uncharacterized protein LOC131209131 [Anopheles bellator]|uniref:uncharacterized protein LOC131209131 n=1 Tax=Anopheles bellator TaxID=139047 RepID=UPI0026499C57|nr:uncharacterized protein LOC131209131 [Anopheles bellator]